MSTPLGPTATAQPPFSRRLRERSAHLHDDAARNLFLSALMAGRLDLSAYAAMVAQNAAIYQALERTGAGLADDPVAGPFLLPELLRGPELTADLAFLRARGVPIADPTPATVRLTERLTELADWPAGFVAHHYVRYLGDLAGGQAVGRLVSRTYGLDRDGIRFYTFEQVPATKPFRDRYRTLLDAAPLAEPEQERLVEEVLLAYRLNVDVLTSLDELVPPYPQVAS